jgi:hypothetical protein
MTKIIRIPTNEKLPPGIYRFKTNELGGLFTQKSKKKLKKRLKFLTKKKY